MDEYRDAEEQGRIIAEAAEERKRRKREKKEARRREREREAEQDDGLSQPPPLPPVDYEVQHEGQGHEAPEGHDQKLKKGKKAKKDKKERREDKEDGEAMPERKPLDDLDLGSLGDAETGLGRDGDIPSY